MKLLKIYPDSHQYLRTKCEEVSLPIDDKTKKIILDMIEYLKLSQDDEFASKHDIRAGVGLSANQIGITKRFFAVNFTYEEKEYKYGLVNPKIISSSVKKAFLAGGEGCLSVEMPHPGNVYRYFKIKIKGYDVVSEKDVVLDLSSYPAIVFQHEYDHLNGVLFYDHIDPKNPFAIDEEAVEI